MSPRLLLELERWRFAPGEAVRGNVTVVEGGRSRSLEVVLQYNEKTKDYLEVASNVSSGPLHEGDLAPGSSFSFELSLPSDALPGYQSEHGELYWEVGAHSDEFGRDTWECHRFDVQPST